MMNTLELFASLIENHDASTEETRITPPFFRFQLCCKSIPPSLPYAMEELPSIEHHWAAFWSKIEPIVQNVERFDRNCKVMLNVFLPVIWLGLASFYFPIGNFPGSLFIGFIAFLVVGPYLFFGAIAISGRTRNAQLKGLKQCCREDEQRVFRAYGFALECEYEIRKDPRGGIISGFYMYLIPLDNNLTATSDELEAPIRTDYVRIEAFRSMPAWCGWNCVSLPSIAMTSDRPPGLESLSQVDWAEFWSAMNTVSRLCVPLLRILIVAHTAPLFLLITGILFFVLELHKASIIFVTLTYVAVVVQIWLEYRFQHLIAKQPLIVAAYTESFAQQGVYMEYRKLVKFHRLSGPCVSHYVYLFPRWIHRQSDVTEIGTVVTPV